MLVMQRASQRTEPTVGMPEKVEMRPGNEGVVPTKKQQKAIQIKSEEPFRKKK